MFNILDLGLIAILTFNGIQGLRKGFFRIALDLVALGVGVFVGITYYPQIVTVIEPYVNVEGSMLHIMAFLIAWGATFLVIMGISLVINKFLIETFFNTFNRVLGLGLGVVKGVVLCLPIVLPLELFEASVAQNSILLKPARPIVLDIVAYFNENESVISHRLRANSKKAPETPAAIKESKAKIKNVMDRNNLSESDLNKIWSESHR